MLTRPVSQAASSAASEIEERLDSPVSVTLPEKSGAAFTLIPARLSFSVLVNQVASASLELRNTGTVAFTFLWTPEKTACDTSNDLFISNDEGILFLPADTAGE
ncbi:hypothetical protein TGME49_230598 [Toxoplasma gondii ME49]|uniref:Uncharacterized protein n=14 Tax=Toxoplasma gondii TaxID=5811 RepID=A0A125YWZ0_TOXGV|nr:hypothetical protein TGME49_230598 [Toxoplasma gondii ME49]EPR64140.1 hypothetical protein TGGT1_230598 [Toxoplasma gondii GT1]ESS35634.1 hypothetical protein TGVEG_230598 [Toxoplasma gondii VEG]KFG48294.1 hypothetical protein TGDOM2_230598 [Toxoplasma gondii GAB2-2007-GAL-DOM2]KFG50891.1 hypothetical protein TGP89_230598 [Toxoplasma gondii p89]KFG55480.1 hypothetical protein TGFOU_230598 [Toxoplasma gondii FOU]KFG63602.1 hypothetical protein TGRUB_230598 [Toxoplasma gondii RUB]KFH10993.1|eukprot:XP_018636879.1 hypothetical protein TGME49_230598 [Toxoplasma gondii ME49]